MSMCVHVCMHVRVSIRGRLREKSVSHSLVSNATHFLASKKRLGIQFYNILIQNPILNHHSESNSTQTTVKTSKTVYI